MKLLFLILLLPFQVFAADLLELRYVLAGEKPGAASVKFQDDTLWLNTEVVISGKDVEKAGVMYGGEGWSILVQLTAEGSKRFDEFAAQHLGDRLAILIRGKVLSAPVVREKKYGGRISVAGGFTQEKALSLAKALNDNAAKP
ncbi:MAG: hypothetical protein JNM65_16355 [Verrucomicrobiaceae bacterium]|nr:hypothetical protein [Verrucomicrobiaceae bacterium]